MLATYNTPPKKITVYAATCGRWCSASSFSNFLCRFL